MLSLFLLCAPFARSEPVFEENASGSGDAARWTVLDGPPSIVFAPHPADNKPALRLGNSIIKAPLSREITGSATLAFQASLGAPARMVQVALVDAKGEKGIIVWYDSGRVGFGLISHEGEWRWGQRHERKGLWQKDMNLSLGELHRFVLDYNASQGELTLSIDGKEAGSAALPLSIKNPRFSQIHVWGNDGSWFRDFIINAQKGKI
ncbi:MAG: hypothetical protein LBK99_08770 [Opitutaceae bacterium]|nr:hypothetical protein [Opitutaceae bacterium]